jgi:hypothetical protein
MTDHRSSRNYSREIINVRSSGNKSSSVLDDGLKVGVSFTLIRVQARQFSGSKFSKAIIVLTKGGIQFRECRIEFSFVCGDDFGAQYAYPIL